MTICQRTACAELSSHHGEEHHDTASPLWDGADHVDLLARLLPSAAQPAAKRLLRTVVGHGDREDLIALHDLIQACRDEHDLAVRARLDGDRRVREAMRRAEDCEVHGHTLTELHDQVYRLDTERTMLDEQRTMWLDAMWRISQESARVKPGSERAYLDTLPGRCAAAGRAQTTIRKRHERRSARHGKQRSAVNGHPSPVVDLSPDSTAPAA